MRAAFEVADVLTAHWSEVHDSGSFNSWQLRTLEAVKRCRTASLGSHVDGCTSCGHLSISYDSCRNRHCPKCQGTAREKWIQAREEELLPVPYFHVVFTLPDALNQLCLYKPKILYDLLFKTTWSVLNSFGHDHNFAYKDYKHGSVKKEMTLESLQFIRRFSLHILPKGFVRIRHYGICSSSSKVKSALIIKAQLPPSAAQLFGAITKAAPQPYNPKQCPCCKKQTMETLMRFNRRGPPCQLEAKGSHSAHRHEGFECYCTNS